MGAGAAATLAFSMMNVAEPLLARAELGAGGAGFALLVCAFGIGSTVGALRGRADGWVLLATLAPVGARSSPLRSSRRSGWRRRPSS